MQPGSIVGLTRELHTGDLADLKEVNAHLEKDTPYVIADGPVSQIWVYEGKKREVKAIMLSEFPKAWFNSIYFSELQPPISSIEIAEMIGKDACCVAS